MIDISSLLLKRQKIGTNDLFFLHIEPFP